MREREKYNRTIWHVSSMSLMSRDTFRLFYVILTLFSAKCDNGIKTLLANRMGNRKLPEQIYV